MEENKGSDENKERQQAPASLPADWAAESEGKSICQIVASSFFPKHCGQRLSRWQLAAN